MKKLFILFFLLIFSSIVIATQVAYELKQDFDYVSDTEVRVRVRDQDNGNTLFDWVITRSNNGTEFNDRSETRIFYKDIDTAQDCPICPEDVIDEEDMMSLLDKCSSVVYDHNSVGKNTIKTPIDPINNNILSLAFRHN